MRKLTLFLLLVTLSAFAAVVRPACAADVDEGHRQAGETPLQSRITSVGLFKNGLAVVKRTVKIPGPGTYRIDDVPQPVHGTLWVESDARIITRVTRRMVEIPAGRLSKADFQQDLVGKQVVIHFADSGIPPASGKVVEVQSAQGEDAWNRTYQQPRYSYYYYGRSNQPSTGSSLLILQTDTGRCYVDSAQIAYLQAKGATDKVRRRLPVLLLSVDEMKKRPATVEINYLAKGMAWAPSYRVDVSDPDELTLHQKAVIKNELEAIHDAEVRLISGFPSVQFAHVTSPLSLRTTWASFFQQLNQRLQSGHAFLSNVVSQQRVDYNAPSPDGGLDLSAIPTGEGVDLHYQNVGRLTLEEGDSLSLPVASGKAPYDTTRERARICTSPKR